ERSGEIGGVLHRNEDSAVPYERGQILDTLPGEAGTYVVCFVEREIRRELRLLPRHWVPPHRHPRHNRLRAPTARRKENHIVPGVQVRVLRSILNADVIVRDPVEIERLSPPAF